MFPSLLRQATSWFQSVPWLVLTPILIVFSLLVTFGVWQYQINQDLQSQSQALRQQQTTSLEEASLVHTQQLAEQEKRQALEKALLEATSSATLGQQQTIKGLYEQFADVRTKLDRNAQAKLDISSIESKVSEWGTQLLKQEFEPLATSLTSAQKSLDEQWSSYQATLTKVVATPKPAVNQPQASNPAGYTNSTVSTSRGNFTTKLIKLPLSQVKVKTVSATTSNCSNNCPAKTLASYVQEQGGFAGMNGSYFCPPDYGSCATKKYSYDFAVYNTPTGNWINQNALGWDALIGLAIFNGSTPTFYKHPNMWGRGAVTAGISNSPGLLVYQNNINLTDANLDSAQRNKGVRGALGVGGGNIYLAIISNASVLDAAYVMQALGASDALNLDGGGSAALYIDGSYKAGPGRLLPNAIVLTR